MVVNFPIFIRSFDCRLHLCHAVRSQDVALFASEAATSNLDTSTIEGIKTVIAKTCNDMVSCWARPSDSVELLSSSMKRAAFYE